MKKLLAIVSATVLAIGLSAGVMAHDDHSGAGKSAGKAHSNNGNGGGGTDKPADGHAKNHEGAIHNNNTAHSSGNGKKKGHGLAPPAPPVE